MNASSVTPARPARKPSLTGRIARTVLQAILILLLLAQLYVWRQGGLPIPAFAVGILEEHLQEQGLRLEYAKAKLHPTGRAVLTSPRIESLTYPSLAVSAERLAVRFSLQRQEKTILRLDSLALDDAKLLCPAELTASGNRETPIRDLHLRAGPTEQGWKIHSLSFQADGIKATFSGDLPSPPPRPPDVEPVSWETGLINAAKIISLAGSEAFQHLEHGWLQARTVLLPEDRIGIQAAFSADAFHHRAGIRLDRTAGRAEFTLDPPEPDATGRLYLEVKNAFYRDEGHLENARVRLDLPPAVLNGTLPAVALGITAERVSVLGEPATNFLLEGNTSEDHLAGLEWHLTLGDGPLRGKANLDWKRGQGVVSANGNANPTSVLRNPVLRESGFRFDVSFSEPPETEATLRFGPDWEPVEADMEVRAGACLIDGVAMDSARVAARWTPDVFDVHTMILQYGDFRVAGSYWNDLTNRDYRFHYRGTVRPGHLSPWFESWWDNLWEPFTFNGPPPAAGIDISGRWGDNDRILVRGWGSGRDLHLRGVPVDQLEARYEAGATWASVTDARLERPEGSAEGRFRYEREGLENLSFAFSSNLEVQATARLLGAEAENLTAHFQFESPPEVSGEGRLFPPEGNRPHPDSTLTLHGRTENPLSVWDLPLEALHLDLNLENSIFTVNSIRGGFSGGEFDAALILDLRESENRLAVRGQLLDAEFGEGTATLVRRIAPDTEAESIENLRNLGGRTDFELDIEGDLRDSASFEGPGKIHITRAELGRIRLLGLLSRLLDLTPLRFTSLQLNELESTFELQGEKIHFPDMRLSGANVRMEARGDYFLEDRDLDFRVKLFPLRESPLPLVSTVIGRILEPLGHIMEVSLTGTLEDPLWRLPIDPRRAFDEGEESPDRPRRTHGPAQPFGN